MTVRGGIADILEAIPEGPMLLAYSGGLHHVQAPGERLPRLFRTIRMNFELVDIATYRAERMREAEGPIGFKRAVVDDLERRRDSQLPVLSPPPGASHPAGAAGRRVAFRRASSTGGPDPRSGGSPPGRRRRAGRTAG